MRDRSAQQVIIQLAEVFPELQPFIDSKAMPYRPQSLAEEQKRRHLLRQQAYELMRMKLEEAGQMVLPIFGDGTAKKLAQGEMATMPFKGIDVREKA